MKSWVSVGRLAAGIFAIVQLGLSSTAFAAVGRTVGTYQVSATGAATYRIPIWAPRGPNGLQPQIALVYDSQHHGDYVGAGWSLSGISSITRCNRTVAQDGTPAPVALTTNDALCLDGERLQVTGGSYGVAGSTYQTEIANFEQVTAYGSAGNGPAYFVVQAPNGAQYEYGNDINGAGSQVLANGSTTALAWYLDKVTDAAGNTMTFSYSRAGLGSAVPATISWTPSNYGANTYNYTMQFTYGTNSAASSYYGYVGGTEVTNTDLLQSIAVSYQGTTVKKYALTYQQSPTTSAEVLTQVEECADAAQTNCLAPTTLGYQAPPVGTTSTAITATTGAASQVAWDHDFNGDGQDDLAFCTASPSLTLEVAFASASGGYSSPINTGISCAGNNSVLYGDFLGTGQDGILASNGGAWYYYQWNGSSFVSQSTGVAYGSNVLQYVAADVDGDGRPDLIEMTCNCANGIDTNVTISVRLNTSSASTVSFSATNAAWYSLTAQSGREITYAELQSGSSGPTGILQSGNVKRLDFNGDGRDDLAFQYQIMYCITFRGVCTDQYIDSANELISTGSGFAGTQIESQTTMTAPIIAFLNFNSDACTDHLIGSTIYVSGCNGTPATTVTVPSSSIAGVMDWNADGRGDILVNNGGTIGVYQSTGTGLGSLIATSIPYSSQNQYFGFDPAGDRLDALGVWQAQASPNSISYYPHNGAGVSPDLITSITDGYGNFAKPSYVSLVQSANSTYFERSDAQFPYENYIGSLYVVSQTTFSDPSNQPNGTYYQQDFYAGAWMNLQGRGFAGFEAHQIHDSRNGVWETWNYDLAFPYSGMLDQDYAIQNNNFSEPIFNRSYTLSSKTLQSTQYDERYFPYASSVTEKDYEVGGAANADLITTKSAGYSYDDWGNLKLATQTVTDNDPSSPYDGDSWVTTVTNTPDVDTSSWCLNLLSESQVAYTASGGATSVTRLRQYTPDATHCRYAQITIEPSSSTYEVSEALGYDSFGNVNSDTITGIGMAARQTSANWGATGQFPMSVTDASGATTQLDYNFSYGLVSKKTDPNGLAIYWTYGDGFGRVTQENRPDSTYTTWTYDLNTGGPLARLVLIEQPHDAAGGVITTRQFFSDMLDRPMYRTDTLLNGTQVWGKVQNYDSLGRIATDCAPYPVGSTSPGCSTYTYDLLNRVTEVQRPISQTDSTLQATDYAYAGDTTTITDPNQHARTLIHNPNGWLMQTKDPLGYAINLGYDAAGAKTSVTDSSGSTLWSGTYVYGIAPFLVGENDVDRGTWGYTVDALGERTAWTDPKGQHFYATYDALSRPLTRTEPDLFTAWTWGASASSHNIGQLASVCTGTGGACSSSYYSENESYDSLGRLSRRAIAIPAMGTYTYTWQYNATTGFLDTLTYPASTGGLSFELQYGYQNGILQSITNILASPHVTIWQANVQNPAGQITQETLGNGLVTNRAYDGVTHWLSSVESGPSGGSSIQNQSFLYDEVGNVTQRQDNNRGLTENIYYDNDNRFSTSTLNGNQNLSVWIAPNGNITRRSDVASGATWTYDPIHLHEVTEAGSTAYTYAYDADGNVTSRQGSSISWSSYNYPTGINDSATGETVSFLYGPDRRAYFEQTQSPSGTETNYHVGGLLDIVTSGGVTDYRHYIYAGSELFAINSRKSDGTNAFHYVLADHQGSVAAITDSTGAVVVGESFTAYGSRRNPNTWSGAPSSSDLTTIAGITREGYTLQDALGQMGLNDMVGRVQDAITGRFLSADPTVPDPSDPQSYNRYSYTRNNPFTYTDPSGFEDNCSDAGGCAGGGDVNATVERMEGFQTVYSSEGSTYMYVTDQETAKGVGGGTQTVTNVFQGDTIQFNAQGGMSNLLGSYHNGQWSSSGLDESLQGGNASLDFGGMEGLGSFGSGFGRVGGVSSASVGVLKGGVASVAIAAQGGSQQSVQCNRATRVGNAFEWAAGKLDDVSAALERTGAATALAGAFGGSAPLAIRGVGLMVVGGAAGLIADFGQEVGGISQMIGGNTSVGRANDIAGSVSLLFGGVTAWAGDAIQVPGGSVAARAFNSSMGTAFAFGGAASDFLQGLSPGMTPTQVGCN